MNIQQIIQAAAQKGVNSSKLSESISKARELLDAVNKPEEALSKIDIDPEFIQTLRSYVDNPLFGWIFPILNHSKEDVKRGLDKAEAYIRNKSANTSLPSPNFDSGSVSDSELEKFKRALSQIK